MCRDNREKSCARDLFTRLLSLDSNEEDSWPLIESSFVLTRLLLTGDDARSSGFLLGEVLEKGVNCICWYVNCICWFGWRSSGSCAWCQITWRRYPCWWCSSGVLYCAAVLIDQAIAQLRIFLKMGPLSQRGVLSTVHALAQRELDLPFHPSLAPPDLLCDATELPPAGNLSFPDRTKRATPSAPQGVFEENVWFSQPFRSLVRQRGQTTTCSRSRNAAAACPPSLPFPLRASSSMFMRKWWAHGVIEGKVTL